MYLAQLTITNFRKIKHAVFEFQPGLNIIVGPNNVGKSAAIEALRALLAGHDEPYPRFGVEDIHCPKGGSPSGDIKFEYTFRGLNIDNQADFLGVIKPGADEKLEACFSVQYGNPDRGGRLRVKRWGSDHEDIGLTLDILENLRGVYLPPLRDASQGLKPGRNSQLARLLQLLADEVGKEGIKRALDELDQNLKAQKPITEAKKAILEQHNKMLGPQLAQVLELGLTATDFKRFSSRLSLLVDTFEIEQNGLGFNNILFMAVVLCELAKNSEAAYRGLIIEEPEAHLHPQLQAVLLRYFENLQPENKDKRVQLFVTSHSPNFASIADLDCLTCLVETELGVETFFPRDVEFESNKREKLKRYLDVTRAELFFARRIIFVEGSAELILLNIFAQCKRYNLREHGVSVISVEGLNFDSFLPLFGNDALKIPVAFITDADPKDECDDGEEIKGLYPKLDDVVTVSSNTQYMKKSQDNFVKVFHGVKTLEYDLALYPENRAAMLEALKELHPKIYKKLKIEVNNAFRNEDKARVLFCGMFERKCNNVSKGHFAQALAHYFNQNTDSCIVPKYILDAIEHVCTGKGIVND